MDFWKIEHPPDGLAALEPATGKQKTYGELRQDVAQAFMPKQRSLVMLLAQNRYECLVTYLAALQSGTPLLVVDSTLNRELLAQLIGTYHPAYIYASSSDLKLDGYVLMESGPLAVWEHESKGSSPIHNSLALLLNTSGSTGSPKLVRRW